MKLVIFEPLQSPGADAVAALWYALAAITGAVLPTKTARTRTGVTKTDRLSWRDRDGGTAPTWIQR